MNGTTINIPIHHNSQLLINFHPSQFTTRDQFPFAIDSQATVIFHLPQISTIDSQIVEIPTLHNYAHFRACLGMRF